MFKSESYTKGTILSLVFNAAAKLIQFANIFIVSFLFGASTDTDLYYFLINFITIVLAGFIGGIDTTILIPEFIRLRENDTLKNAMGFINKYLYIYLIIGLLFSMIVVFVPVPFYGLVSKFSSHILVSNISALYLSIPLFFLIILCNLMSNVLVSYKYFTMPNVVAFINSLLAVIFLFLFHKKIGITSAILGFTVGYFVNFFLLITLLYKKLNWNFKLIKKGYEKRLLKSIGSNQFISLIVSIRMAITQFLLSGFLGGTLTAINWGNQIATVSDNFINTQMYSIAGIKFSEQYATNQKEKSIQFFYTILSLLIAINIMAITVYVCCANEIAFLLNFKGKMSMESLEVLKKAIIFLSIVPLINIITFLISKLLASYQLINKTFVQYSFIGQILLLIFTWLLIHYFGYVGYLYASILGFGSIAILYVLLIKKHFDAIKIKIVFSKYIFNGLISILFISAIHFLLHDIYFKYFTNKIIYILLILTSVFLIFLKSIKKDVIHFKESIQ